MKKHIAIMLVIMLLLPQIVTFTSLSADGDIVITTGAEFKANIITANVGKTFIIEGTETLADGSKGIIIPSDYKPLSNFYGTIKGIDGKNNIQTGTFLFYTINRNYGPILFENLIFKPDGESSVKVNSNSGAGGGIIAGQIANGANGDKVTFKNIINYVDVENIDSGVGDIHVGSLLGYNAKAVTLEFINCVNYGNVTAKEAKDVTSSSDFSAGGIIGKSQTAGSVVVLQSCYNYGNVTSLTGSAGGIIGARSNQSVNDIVTECANYGSILAKSTNGIKTAAGIAGSLVNVSKSFNAGKVESPMLAGGILGTSTVATVTVDNCFNVGEVKSTDTTGKYFAGGIAGSYAASLYTVTNCYNAGMVTGTGAKQIGDTKTNAQDILCEGNLYVGDTDLGEVIGTNITSSELSSSLPSNFSSSVWEIVSSELIGEKGYTYPQIKNNWYDHKFKLDYKNFADYKSETSGEVTGVDTVKFDRNTSVYKDVNTATILESMCYPGLTGALLILNESTNTSGATEFSVDKSAEVILAVDKELTSSMEVVVNGGFTPLKYLDTDISRQAGLVTKDGTVYYLYKKIVLDTSEVFSIDASDMGLTKGYIVFVNWIDSYTMTIENKGNAKVEIDGVEKTDTAPITVAKGTYYDVKVIPDEDYYITSITLNNEKIAENIVDFFLGSYDGNKDLSFVIETSQYKLSPEYSIKQELGAGNTVKQILVVKGNMENFLAGGTVNCTLSKNSSTVYSKEGTIGGDGSFTIEFPLLDTDTGIFDIEFTLTFDGETYCVSIDDDKNSYDVPSVADVNSLLTKLNNDNITAIEFTSLVLEERASLPFKTGVFKHLDGVIQALVSEAFIDYDDFTIENLYERFDEEVILKTVNNSEKSEDFKAVIDIYGEKTGIKNSPIYSNYEALVNPEPCYTILKTGTFVNYQDIVNLFEYAVIYGELSNVTSYDNIIDILGTYKTMLGIETEVASIGNMVDAKIKIVNDETGKALNTLVTKELLKAKLQYLITNADTLLAEKMGQTVTPVLPPVIIGGGSTGGGGGGGSVSVSQNYVQKETVEPIPSVESINDFNDIGDVAWAQDSIRELLYRGIVRGKESGKFCPSDTVTRAEFIKMAVVAFNLMEQEASCNFSDIPTTHWSYPYVSSAVKTGIASGYSKDEFGVDGHITRQDMIAILIRVTYKLGLQESMENRKEKLVTFTDEDKIASYAVGGVNMLSGCGIISGYEDGSFGPQKELTRAEAATVLARYLEFFEI